jgi:glycosyltransferase involved in cell wall biosynthesis
MGEEAWPLVSIVTPTLDAGAFLEETIRSVLAQDYPNLEYLVMDGGSTDGTLRIVEKYAARLRWSVQRDAGTADAIDKGFAMARGSILAFLNADDAYLPGAVSAAVRAFAAHPEVAVVYGEGDWVDERGEIIGRYPTKPFDREVLRRECCICQPAAFIRRAALEAVGGLDPTLHYAFDWDLWIRIADRHEMLKIGDSLATSRLHRACKSVAHPESALAEALEVLRRHCDYIPARWIYRSSRPIVGRRIEFSLCEKPSLLSYLVALPLGLLRNPRHPLRYTAEWGSLISGGARRLREPRAE